MSNPNHPVSGAITVGELQESMTPETLRELLPSQRWTVFFDPMSSQVVVAENKPTGLEAYAGLTVDDSLDLSVAIESVPARAEFHLGDLSLSGDELAVFGIELFFVGKAVRAYEAVRWPQGAPGLSGTD